ncbi:hypothetical protein [Christiangramia sp. SM2212]|uniref:Outer membrane protein beta-barrel domain-containing protein n=1 Tax=Christiangramia sediminicola TaxID=3073267 RepID=A0ABU1EVG3_9FLAO|nr:hypothetical protein [Christiangramia sp. SM2212]MDR5592052.1 hypothetical protein [Christiangramia sp. SM2212]
MKEIILKLTIVLSILTISIHNIHAQDSIKKNSIYTEIGGNGVLYSINYERLYNVSKLINITSRIGYGYFTINRIKANSIPFEINGLYAIAKQKHFIEIGSGITYLDTKDLNDDPLDITALIYAARLGYRYQKPTGGIMYRIGITPLYDFYSDKQNLIRSKVWFLIGGISIGYNF